jgi:hypothetical protein
MKEREGRLLVSAHASTVYAVWRIKAKKSKSYRLYFWPNLNSPMPCQNQRRIWSYTGRFHVVKMRESMRSIHRKLRGPSLPPKTQLNRIVLFRTRFRTIWRSEIHISLKVDSDALNRCRRLFLLLCTIHYIRQGQWRQYAMNCACVYDIWNVKNKIRNSSSCYRQ